MVKKLGEFLDEMAGSDNDESALDVKVELEDGRRVDVRVARFEYNEGQVVIELEGEEDE